jgi:rfaE bifunctional protein kinase chain/domain
MMTPNRGEFRQIVGAWKSDADLARRAQKLRRQLGLEALLVTLGEDGMTLFRQGGALHVKAEKREVYDVSGAGDTVIATLATMLAAGISLEQAVRYANRAAGIKVTRFGTAAVTRAELFG